jgi:hypothetical protein
MRSLLLILVLAAPFILIAALIAFLVVYIGSRTSRPK